MVGYAAALQRVAGEPLGMSDPVLRWRRINRDFQKLRDLWRPATEIASEWPEKFEERVPLEKNAGPTVLLDESNCLQ